MSELMDIQLYNEVKEVLESARSRAYAAVKVILRYMRKFYLTFPIRDALRHELTWTHYGVRKHEKRNCERTRS